MEELSNRVAESAEFVIALDMEDKRRNDTANYIIKKLQRVLPYYKYDIHLCDASNYRKGDRQPSKDINIRKKNQ